MPRILAIDYGSKRTGLAVTDPLQIIASALETVPTAEVFDFLKTYLEVENVERFVVGEPTHQDGNPSQIAPEVEAFLLILMEKHPEIPVSRQDERHSSNAAKAVILQSGLRKMARRDKSRVDKIAAALILEAWMHKHIWR